MPRRAVTIIISYLVIYLIAAFTLAVGFDHPLKEILIPFFYIGIVLSLPAILFPQDKTITNIEKPTAPKEPALIILLIAWIGLYITFGSQFIDQLISPSLLQNPRAYSFLVLARKVLVFVLVPFLLYASLGFSLKNFGMGLPVKEIFTRRNSLIFLSFSIAVLFFQLYFSTGGRNFRNESFSVIQFISASPLIFIWLFIEAGLVEEFFFRALLQSRLAILFKSPAGGIVVSSLLFGLVHAPGLYLRGAGSEGIEESLPFIFFVVYTITYMSVAGIFLGILYYKTKNLWLVMAIHAMADLIPNFKEFAETWHF